MKKFLKILKIGFVTFFVASFDEGLLLITNKYPDLKQMHYFGAKIWLGFFLIGIIAMLLSEGSEKMQENVFLYLKIIFAAIIIFEIRIFFIIWRKLFKEKWEKEQ
jgi:hypothetical protein